MFATSVLLVYPKNKDTWCSVLGRWSLQIRFNPKSIQWVVLKVIYCIILRDSDGNLNVPYLNWNGDRWVLNFNWLDNDFNDNDRLARGYSLYSPPIYIGGVSFLREANHPPIIFPTSANSTESVVNLLLSKAFNSQSNFRKNLRLSILTLNFWIVFNFCQKN